MAKLRDTDSPMFLSHRRLTILSAKSHAEILTDAYRNRVPVALPRSSGHKAFERSDPSLRPRVMPLPLMSQSRVLPPLCISDIGS